MQATQREKMNKRHTAPSDNGGDHQNCYNGT